MSVTLSVSLAPRIDQSQLSVPSRDHMPGQSGLVNTPSPSVTMLAPQPRVKLAYHMQLYTNYKLRRFLKTLNPLLATEPSALSLMNILLLVDLMMGG